MKLFYTVFVFAACMCIVSRRCVSGTQAVARITGGDVILGGLFPIHYGEGCNNTNHERGIHRMEAMLYAVDEINRNTNIIPNITLGAEIRDSCSDGSKALEESLEFMFESKSLLKKTCQPGMKTLIGVVGAASSSVSIEVANFLRLFRVSQVSYASTSPTLSDKSRFDYFVRTVPPDTLQARTLVDIVKYFNWTSVFTVHSEGSYGEKGMKLFEQLAAAERICVISSKELDEKITFAEYKQIVKEFLGHESTRVVVLFTKNQHTKRLLAAVKSVVQKPHFTWVASDTWGTRTQPVKNFESVADGAITVTLKLSKVNDFEAYFRNLTPRNNFRNPWFREYWEEMRCANNSNRCRNILNLRHFDDKVPFVIDAVYSFAHALNEFYRMKCPAQNGVCERMVPFGREEFHGLLKNNSFMGKTGKIEFDKNGDSTGKYDIMMFDGETGQYNKIGTWNKKLTIYHEEPLRSYHPVKSSCGEPCQMGQRKSFIDRCCWTCESCADTQYLADNKCMDCQLGNRPNRNRSGCEPLPRMGFKMPLILSLTCTASVGIIISCSVTILFLVNYNKSLVRASGRDIMFVLLLGIHLCYILTILLVFLPVTTKTCYVQRFFLGLPLTLCYAAILVKTCRVSRIFSRKIGRYSLLCITQRSQRGLLLALFAIQVCISLANIFFKEARVIESFAKTEVFLLCNFSHIDIIFSFGIYNFLLVLLCTYFAFRTRRTPANFNESRFIGSAMYVTCAIWIILCIVYFVLDENIKAKTILISMNPLISATTLLGFIFGSKAYNLVFNNNETDSPRQKRTRKITNEISTDNQGYENRSGPVTISSTSMDNLFKNDKTVLYNPLNADMDTNVM